MKIVLLTLCLAGSGLLGAEALRIIGERRGGALWHEQELSYISEVTPAVLARATAAPVDNSATPEPEDFEGLEPIAFAATEVFVRATEPPFPMHAGEPAGSLAPEATPQGGKTTRAPVAGETPPEAVAPTAAPESGKATHAPATGEATDAPASGETPPATVAPTDFPGVRATPAPTRAVDRATPTVRPTASPTQEVRTVGRSVASPMRYTMDFAQLSMLNEDARGWLIAEDTTLNYPVVQGKDNEYYLTHLFSGKKNKTGTVFMDCGNSRYFTDQCIWLYAHNRRDDSMFATIPNYAEQAFFDAHPTMYLLTPYEDYLVELFACIRSDIGEADAWHIKSFEGKAAFEAYVREVRSQSVVKSGTSVLWGDQLLAMSTCTNEVHEERYVLFGVLRPIAYEDEAGMSVTQLELEARECYTKTVDIPGFGEAAYYAQNDPTWATMVYEERKSQKHRRFGTSGGGPAALAMAIASLADDEQLSRLLVCPSSEYGYSLCTCSVNQFFCDKTHVQMRVDGLQNLRRYLPVVMASFATGNNLWGVQSRSAASGTNEDFFPYVANACSLDYRNSREPREMIAALQSGAVVVASTSGSSSPFTGGGHYVVLISMDETYLYILDPYLKEDYGDTDKRHVLDVMEPGVVRVKWENVDRLRLCDFSIIRQRPGYVPPEP